VLGDDACKHVESEAFVSLRDISLDPGEKGGLIAGRDPAAAPVRARDEVPHAGRGREVVQAGLADAGEDRVGRVVVGELDHPPEEVPLSRGQIATCDILAAKVGDEQHRLDLGCGVIEAEAMLAEQPPTLVVDRERDAAAAIPRPPRRRLDLLAVGADRRDLSAMPLGRDADPLTDDRRFDPGGRRGSSQVGLLLSAAHPRAQQREGGDQTDEPEKPRRRG